MDCGDDEKKDKTSTSPTTIPINSSFGAGCLFATGFLSFVTIGLVFSYMSPVIPAFHHMYNSTYMSRYGEPIPEDTWTLYLTLTLSTVIVGAAVGGITSKYWLLMFSRKHLLQLCHVINIFSVLVMALIGALTWSWEVMIIGRFICGLPIGVYYSLISTMIPEMSARSKQAFWLSVAGFGVCVGVLIGGSFSQPKVLGSIQLWPVLISLGAIPSMIYLIWSHWIPETPFYLLRECGRDEALLALKKLRVGDENDCREEVSDMQSETKGSTIIGIKEMVTTKQYRNQLIAVIALFANLMLVGINNVLLYADYVLKEAGVPADTSGTATIGIFALMLIAGLFGSYFNNRFGGLKVNVAANAIIILAHTLFTITQATVHLAPNVMPILSVVAVGIFIVGWSGGSNPATLVLTGQLITEPAKPTAFQYGAVSLWFCAWFVGFIPPYLQKRLGPYSFALWLGFAVFFLIYQVIFLPDPKGKTVEEIQAKFK